MLLIGSGHACHNAEAKDFACKILALQQHRKIDIANVHPSGVHDHAYSISNIHDACKGIGAARSRYVLLMRDICHEW